MPLAYTGTEIARKALRRINVLDPAEDGIAEQIDPACEAGDLMLDDWRTQRLTIGGMTRGVYALTSGQQDYTIGTAGDFNQDYPSELGLWSVIPDRTATNPVELPMGRPLTVPEWQGLGVKSITGGYPTALYFDRSYAAGLGTCSFVPIPTSTLVSVVLYTKVPAITSIDADTTYTLPPGAMNALILNLAVRLGLTDYAKERGLPPGLEKLANRALGTLKRSNLSPNEGGLRPEFAIGSSAGRRTFNVRTGG